MMLTMMTMIMTVAGGPDDDLTMMTMIMTVAGGPDDDGD